jgi:hypothetical protein
VGIIIAALVVIGYLWYKSNVTTTTANPTSAVGSKSVVKSCCGAIL